MILHIILVSLLIFGLVAFLSRGSTFDGVNSDAFKQVNAAAHFNEWGGWPSGMHKFAGGKALMKDLGVLLLVPMQRILNDRKGFYPVVMVSNLAHAISGILLFLIAENYWGDEAGLAIFVLYSFCFWPYMIVLHGGLHIVAQLFFLLSVFSLQQAEVSLELANLLWYFGAGISFGLVNFASASGRKFISVFVSVLIFHSSGNHALPWLFSNIEFNAYIGISILIGLSIFLVLFLGIISFNYKIIVRKIYHNEFSFIKFNSRNKNEINIYYSKVKKIINRIQGFTVFFIMVMVLSGLYFYENESYILFGSSVSGMITTVIILTAPNFLQNLLGYYDYWTLRDLGGHHPIYNDYFNKKYGQVFQQGEEGLIWYFKFFKRMIPFHLLLYSISFFLVCWEFFANPELENSSKLMMLLISVIPIIWNELTFGPKASLPMYTSFILLLVPFGYVFNESSINNWNYLGYDFNFYLWFVIVLSSAWNIYIFFSDTLPCRMTTTRIVKMLNKYKIKKIYTYDTKFNYPFMDIIKHFFPGKYDIEYISSIDQVDDGYVFVPCTGSKSAYFQSVDSIGPVGDFKGDNALNSIIETRKIQKLSIASFKTFGNSKYWQQIGDLVSFRDLILKEVTSKDRFLGHAWLLKIEKNINH